MKNVQITIDHETLSQVDRVGKPLGLKRSEIVRQALRDWLRRHAVENFEKEWIEALHENPDDAGRAEDWKGVQVWSKSESR
jgi:metal-responsive CopG/Arc/MetJ family transcriptional regulator